jgi:hypothetical protein
MRTPVRSRDIGGASLVGILAIVVILGVMSVVAVVGVNSLTDSNNPSLGSVSPSTTRPARGHPSDGGLGGVVGPAATAACNTAAATADTASAAVFASNGGAYPTQWSDLTTTSPPIFVLPTGVLIEPKHPTVLDANGWKLTMTGDGQTAPTFACTYPRR